MIHGSSKAQVRVCPPAVLCERTSRCLIASLPASTTGTADDNPVNALNLTAGQSDRTVTFLYKDVSTINFTLMVSGSEDDTPGGRNFLFAGKRSVNVTIPKSLIF